MITAVELTAPYNTNTQELTLNSAGSILSEEAATTDPVVNYSYIDEDDITQGIFAWVAFGIDLTFTETLTAAASLYAEGGVENASSGGGGNGASPS